MFSLKNWKICLGLILVLSFSSRGVIAAEAFFTALPKDGKWYKAQFHVHNNWGLPNLIPTTSPHIPLEFYFNRDYNVVAFADLNYTTPVYKGIKDYWDRPGRNLVIAGNELNCEPIGKPPYKVVDSIVIGLPDDDQLPVPCDRDWTTAEVLDAQAKIARDNDGIPVIAHPNLFYSVTAEDVLATDPERIRHMEIRNGEPGMNDFGGNGHPSTFEIWDTVLSTGRQIFGWGTDDSHHFPGQSDPNHHNPRDQALADRVWMHLYMTELSEEAVRFALDNGHFYASTGVKFVDFKIGDNRISIVLDPTSSDIGWHTFYLSEGDFNPTTYRTQFIGKAGEVLAVDETYEPHYECSGDDLYVRAVVTNSDGWIAFTNALFCSDD
jgi:hypothetical protein